MTAPRPTAHFPKESLHSRVRGLEGYAFIRSQYDLVPPGTFLIRTVPGYSEVVRVVVPNRPEVYQPRKLTPDGRLLYSFWCEGMACKRLRTVEYVTFQHVVYPGEPGYDMLEAFKVACDTRRAWASGPVAMPPTLLCRALGIEEPAP